MDRFTTTPPIEEPREDMPTLARSVRQIKYALETPSVLAAQLNELFNAGEVKRFEGIARGQSSLTDQQALQGAIVGDRFVAVEGQVQEVSGTILDVTDTLIAHTDNTANPHGTNWTTLLDKPTEFPPAPHTHVEADITDLDKYTKQEVDDLISGAGGGSGDWADITNKPTEFPPEAHTHVEADITDLDKYTKQEVDDLVGVSMSGYLPLTGGNLSGNIRITNDSTASVVVTANSGNAFLRLNTYNNAVETDWKLLNVAFTGRLELEHGSDRPYSFNTSGTLELDTSVATREHFRDKSIPNILLDSGSNSGYRARLAFGGDSDGAGACGIDALSNSSQLRLWVAGDIEGLLRVGAAGGYEPLDIMTRARSDALYVPLAGGQFTGPLGLLVTSAGSMPVGVEGEVVFCSDGDGGSPCLAVHDGTDWRRVALGAAVSAT